MFSQRVVTVLAGLSCCLVTTLSQAQCSKDTDCKGDRVCEGGACVTPAAPLSPAPAGAGGVVTGDGSAPSTAAPAVAAPAPAAAPPPPEAPREASVPDAPPKRRRHSTGMMTGGIVMVSFVPIALLAAMVANIEQDACERGTYFDGSTSQSTNCGRFDVTIYGGLLGAAALAGVGIPFIVIGGKKEPVATARLAPWASPHGAGLGLRFDL